MRRITTSIVTGSLALGMALASPLAAATTLEFWTAETQSERLKVIDALTTTFEALNPDITIKVVPVDDDQIATQMAAASAAGTLPQLVETNSEQIMAFGEAGIVDTGLNAKVRDAVGTDRFYEGALKMLSSPDEDAYGIPYHGWIQGIWYRKDWFKQEGLEPPTTWDAIRKAAKVFNNPGKNRYGILIGTKAEGYTEQVFTQLALSNGVSEFDDDGKLVFDSPKTVETLKFYKDLAQYTPNGPQSWRARDYYLQGKMAMFFYSTYIMDDLALAEVAKNSLTSENFAELKNGSFDPELVKNTGFVPVINHTQDASYGVVVGLSAIDTKDAAKAKATEAFMQFLYEPAAYISFLHMAPGGMNPMLKDIAKDKTFLDEPSGTFKLFGMEKLQEIFEGFDDIRTFAVVDGHPHPEAGEFFAKNIIPTMVYNTVFEGAKPEAAVKQAAREMQDLLDAKGK
ncbi:ABC transporter substrate-binding protein [Pokkaliibacter sp. CJK22405]|uniref:ABC transporter substrate-binding protein n=1 Tax=Pokkaliibacter sp. CJK22405 TaxID=3384615 RepID=UPI0039854603